MTKLLSLWNFLDGKKTNIAMGLFLLSQVAGLFMTQFLTGIWHIQAPGWFPQIISSINWFATALGGTGLMHQGVKAAYAKAQALSQ